MRCAIPTILIVIISVIIYLCSIGKTCIDTERELNKYIIDKYVNIYKGRGVDPNSSKYVFDSLEINIPVLDHNLDESTIAARKELVKAMNQIINQNSRTLNQMGIDINALNAAQDAVNKNGVLINETSKVNYFLLPILKSRTGSKINEKEASTDCEIELQFKVLIDTTPMKNYIYTNLLDVIYPKISKLLDSVRVNPSSKIDMCIISETIKNDKDIINQVDNKCKSDSAFFNLFKDKKYSNYINEAFFGKGQYDIPLIYKPILSEYFKIIKLYVDKNPNQEFDLICKGYADGYKIYRPGISLEHSFDIQYNNQFNPIAWSNTKSSEASRQRYIRNNDDLSHVRAYMGINELMVVLNETKISLPSNLKLYYQGTRSSSNLDPCLRKIEFQLIKKIK